jgi:hypothetical protein
MGSALFRQELTIIYSNLEHHFTGILSFHRQNQCETDSVGRINNTHEI